MCTVTKKTKNKVKRPRCNWYVLMCYIGDYKMSRHYWRLKSKHPGMSDNRIAYNVLKSNYSTTALERYRYFGEVPV